MSRPPRWRRVLALPESRAGRWSVGLLAALAASLALLMTLVALGQRGGETFFSNSRLALTGLAVAFLGRGGDTVSGDLAGRALHLRPRRPAIGLFVMFFVTGELAVQH